MSEIFNSNKIAYNTKESIEVLGINRSLLDSYRKKGLIKCVKLGRNYLYPKTELESFIQRNLGNEITKEGLILWERNHIIEMF